MAILDNWIADLPQQFQGKKYIETLISAFSKQIGELHEVFNELSIKTDLEGATGRNLDMVGDIVSLTRKEAALMAGVRIDEPIISDDRYRQFLKYKVLKNTNDCTYYDIMKSIEILWDTSNIKYIEDPSRPATILIRLHTINVDSDVDPAVGKTLAVKPAGVALIYTIHYCTVFDHTERERIECSRIKLHYGMPFYLVRLFDGSWNLEGSVLMDAIRTFETNIGLKISYKNMIGETFDHAEVVAKRNLWYFDGSVIMDGSRLLNAEIRKDGL